MNVIFITSSKINNIDDHGIYQDLLRELAKNGNDVFIVSPIERKYKQKTKLIEYIDYNDWHKNIKILKVKTGNIQKTNIIEKGISTLTFESKIIKALKKYTKKIKFDLVLYSTPPITTVKPLNYIKKRDNAKTYLMLKDIFPQNALDLGILSKKGIKGIIYNLFRKKEKKLYSISDKIGCMSQANINYILENNKEINENKLELFPNCAEVIEISSTLDDIEAIRIKYKLPINKKIFVYGGNLGKPQAIPFIIECLKKEKYNDDAFFLIIGDGTEYPILERYYQESNQKNFTLMKGLPKDEYDKMITACDVGMIFLDYRFTIPNYPSRLLSYMQAGLPVLVCSDLVTDIGSFVSENSIGIWLPSNDIEKFSMAVKEMTKINYDKNHIIECLKKNFDVKKWVNKIIE